MHQASITCFTVAADQLCSLPNLGHFRDDYTILPESQFTNAAGYLGIHPPHQYRSDPPRRIRGLRILYRVTRLHRRPHTLGHGLFLGKVSRRICGCFGGSFGFLYQRGRNFKGVSVTASSFGLAVWHVRKRTVGATPDSAEGTSPVRLISFDAAFEPRLRRPRGYRLLRATQETHDSIPGLLRLVNQEEHSCLESDPSTR